MGGVGVVARTLLSTCFAIGVLGDTGVKANAQQEAVFVGMVLIRSLKLFLLFFSILLFHVPTYNSFIILSSECNCDKTKSIFDKENYVGVALIESEDIL